MELPKFMILPFLFPLPLRSRCAQETTTSYVGARQSSPPSHAVWKAPTRGVKGEGGLTPLLTSSAEIAKMPVTSTSYISPSETLHRAFTCAARLPASNNDLWDRCDPKRWQWHHQHPYVSHTGNYSFYIGFSEEWSGGSSAASFVFSCTGEKGWNNFLNLECFS